MERQIVLDTETTGLEVERDHRIIEIGCVELRNRRVTGNDFHHYLNPGRDIEAGAEAVHGIRLSDLADKPGFAEIAPSFIEYIRGAELIIHNAAFDVGFLNRELERAGIAHRIEDLCRVVDSLEVARRLHPGQKNSLDALCRRYNVDSSQREQHGALLDARLLADVYVAMTSGQAALVLERVEKVAGGVAAAAAQAVQAQRAQSLKIVRANEQELAATANGSKRSRARRAGACGGKICLHETGFNEAEANSPRKSHDRARHPQQQSRASMRPRRIRLGNIGHR